MPTKKPTPKAKPAAKTTKTAKQPAKAVKGTKAVKPSPPPQKPSNLDCKIANLTKEETPAKVIAGIRKDAEKAAAGGGSPPKGKGANPVEGEACTNAKKDEQSYGDLLAEITRNFDLSDREARFVMEMAVDSNASAAYLRAGYTSKSPDAHASRLAVKGSIQSALTHVRAKVAERTGFTSEEALQLAADILRADTRELVEYKVSCCRYCYGDHHGYQRTAGEMAMARARHEAVVERRKERNRDYVDPGFDEQGGEGFDLRRAPNTECPVCGGDGEGRVVVKDTRTVSKAAAALFAGVKEGKDGIEVKFHDKATMLDKMFRYHGLYEVDNKQKTTAAADPAALIALSEAMDRSREQRRAVMEQRRMNGFTGD